MKALAILMFLLPFVGLAYVAWHTWQLLPQVAWLRIGGVAVVVLSFACLLFNFVVGLDHVPMALARVIYTVGTSSLFVMLYAVLLFLLLDLGSLLHVVPSQWVRASGVGSIAVVAILAAVFGYGRFHYGQKQRRTLDLKAEQPLPRPLRVVMVSDLHLGYHNTRQDLRRWIDLLNAEHPDLVLVCGDIVDISTRPLREEGMAEEWHRLQAPVMACLGNHEYYAGAEKAADFFREAGITLLRDSVAQFRGLTIVGRDDRSNPHRKSLGSLLKGVERGRFTLLLDHQPYHLEQAERMKIDFQLSGHTHYGQVWPISWIEDAIYENAYGASRRGRTQFYVTSGLGIWGGKFRIGTCSEYVVADIR